MYKTVMTITRIETNSYLRDWMAIFWTFAYPVILLVVLNAMFGGSDKENGGYSAFLISGLTAMSVVTIALFGFAIVLVSLRDEGKLKLFEMMPMKKLDYLLGFAFSRVSMMVLFSLLFVLITNTVYGAGLILNVLSVLSFLLLITLGGFSFISVSFLIVSFISKPNTASAFINIIAIPILFLSDLFIPIRIMPEYIQKIISVTPVYIFVDACREILIGGASLMDVASGMLILLVFGLVSFLVAAKTFKFTPAVA